MKRPQEWEEQDLLEMILNAHEENVELDFKRAEALGRSDGKKAEIAKDVSSFANSAGGTILYGMEENPSPPHSAFGLSPVNPAEFSKEWLEQVINSRIHPRIDGLIINPIELKSKSPGSLAYAVVVPESTTAHQASDFRYYKRYNFESRPMEDYEVRLSMNRASRPAYGINLRAVRHGGRADAQVYMFDALIENESDIVGHEVAAVLFVPQTVIERSDDRTYKIEGLSCSRIPGTFAESSDTLRTAIRSAHPLRTYSLNFMKSIFIKVHEHYSPPHFQVVVRLYDQYGLALTASFRVSVPQMEVTLVSQCHCGKRSTATIDM
jgi:hypothetical protein